MGTWICAPGHPRASGADVHPHPTPQRNKKDPAKHEKMKEVVDLCKQHIEECENLEKRRFNEKFSADRVELMKGKRADALPSPLPPLMCMEG